jgi:hypothetical protein
MREDPGARAAEAKAHHRDTPPEDDILSRQVSWLTGRRPRPVFPRPKGLSDRNGQRLAAYSCGGSFGITAHIERLPNSLLAPNQNGPQNHDKCELTKKCRPCQSI